MQQRYSDATEAVTLRAKVEKLRAIEKVREDEHERWADDLIERFRAEKSLEERIAMLEAGTASRATTAPTGGLVVPSGPLTSDSSVTSPATSMTVPSTPLTSASTSTASRSTTVVSGASTSSSVTSSPPTSMSVTGSTSVISSIVSVEVIVKLFETQSLHRCKQLHSHLLFSFNG